MSADQRTQALPSVSFAIRLEKTKIEDEASNPAHSNRMFKSKVAKLESRFYSIYNKIIESNTIHKEYLTSHFINRMLQKPEKNERDAIILYEYFKDYPFFLQFFDENQDIEEKDAFLYLLKHSNLVSGDMGETIYSEGSMADGNIYIVLKGKVCMIERGTGAGGLNEDQLMIYEAEKAQEESANNNKSPKKKNPSIAPTFGPTAPKVLSRGPSKKNVFEYNNSPLRERMANQGLKINLDSSSPKQYLSTPNVRSPTLKSPLKSPSKKRENILSKLKQEVAQPTPSPINKFATPAKSRISALFRWAQLISKNGKKEITDLGQSPDAPKLTRQMSIYNSISRDDFENSNSILKYMVEPEGYFGHNIAYDGSRKETAILMEYSELMILRRDHFNAIFQRFSKKKIRKLNFMIDYMPNIEVIHNNQVLENLSMILSEKKFRFGDCIVIEGKSSDFFYMLVDGRCDVVKTLIINEPMRGGAFDNAEKYFRTKQNSKEEIRLNILENGSFFAEEVLTRKDRMVEYTVKVTSPIAIVYQIHRRRFLMRFPKDIIRTVNKLLVQKREEKREMLDSILKFKGIEFNPAELYIGGPIVKEGRFRANHHLLHKSNSLPRLERIEEPPEMNLSSFITNINLSATPSILNADYEKKIKVSQLLSNFNSVTPTPGSGSINLSKNYNSGRNSAILAELDNSRDSPTFIPRKSKFSEISRSKTLVQKSHSQNSKSMDEKKSKIVQKTFLNQYEHYLEVMRTNFKGVDDVLKHKIEKVSDDPKTYSVLELEGDALKKRERMIRIQKLKQKQENEEDTNDSLLSVSILKNYKKILDRTKSREGKTYIDRLPLIGTTETQNGTFYMTSPDSSTLNRLSFLTRQNSNPLNLREVLTPDDTSKEVLISKPSSTNDSPIEGAKDGLFRLPKTMDFKSVLNDKTFVGGGIKTMSNLELRTSKWNGLMAKRVGGFATKASKETPTHKRNNTMPFLLNNIEK